MRVDFIPDSLRFATFQPLPALMTLIPHVTFRGLSGVDLILPVVKVWVCVHYTMMRPSSLNL